MNEHDTLVSLWQKVSHKKQLEAKQNELREQRKEYERSVISLRDAFHQEQKDVEKLEGRSLANYFYNVIGKLDEKLDQERREAYAARVKLDAAERELACIEQDFQQTKSELAEALVAESRFKAALDRKRAELKASGTPTGDQVLELEQRIAGLDAQKEEIRQAKSAGHSAGRTAERILSELDDADGWNTWDMIGGGGIITHVAKHGHLDEAQDLVQELQSQLRRFKTELADIQIRAELQVNIDGFLRFADYFFDGLFADWAVGDRISQSRSAVHRTKDQISQMLNRLDDLEAAAQKEWEALNAQLEELVIHG